MFQIVQRILEDGEKAMKVFASFVVVALLCVTTTAAFAQGPDATGFDECGYNNQANIFVGSADCVDHTEDGTVWGDPTYANDHLVMKWSQDWDDAAFNGQPFGDGAWENNHWNGNAPGGSGETWHYQIDYSQVCAEGGTPTDGGGCIWGNSKSPSHREPRRMMATLSKPRQRRVEMEVTIEFFATRAESLN
jgi:hypothetical protein